MSLISGLKRGFYTYSLSPQAYCLYALFYLYQTKSIIRTTFGHWILTFESSSWKSLNKISHFLRRNCIDFCTGSFSVFLEYKFEKAFQKCINVKDLYHNKEIEAESLGLSPDYFMSACIGLTLKVFLKGFTKICEGSKIKVF